MVESETIDLSNVFTLQKIEVDKPENQECGETIKNENEILDEQEVNATK